MATTINLQYFTFAIALSGLLPCAQAQAGTDTTEQDYLGDLPVVLSVSRIAQRLDDIPASVTVIDRDMIRQSGARDVADLLRFVPGFYVTSSFETNAPQGSYQLLLKDYANRIQVLVDGRSVYSPLLFGSTGAGLQAIALDDIERIEVTRGTNSATYGARAFLGVINIVSRDTADTLGTSVQLVRGQNGIQDGLARIGWGDAHARYRLTVDHRGDSGLQGAGGDDFVNRVNFTGTVKVSANNRLDIRAGQSVISAGMGFKQWDDAGIRDHWITTSFLQLDGFHIVDANEDFALQYSHTQESVQDLFPNTTYAGVVMDLGGSATTDNLLLQHSYRFSSALRWTAGAEWRRESVRSLSLFNTDAGLQRDFYRLFANAEWRLLPGLILNVGNMLERDTDSGDTNSPRAMLNWHVSDGQTIRYGYTKAFRPPSMFEGHSHQVYQSPSLAVDFPGGRFVNFQSIGGLAPETISGRELGYVGNFASLGLLIDAHVFDEEVTGLIKERRTDNGYTKYFVNTLGRTSATGVDSVLTIHGAELQIQWSPWDGGKLSAGYSWIDNGQPDPRKEFTSSSLMFRQRLPHGFEFSLMYSQYDGLLEFPVQSDPAPGISRTDIRVAKSFRIGAAKGELSFVVQNLGPEYQDNHPDFRFRQQAYIMVKIGM